ncbi:hypothetical protein [Bacteroides cellulosilyticus]|uniref:hypothetical protein n=1 Tax=Bacteroides cellulosilyticus TaxID=246787 RepID=UPI001C37ABE9|nr:hypothetical protein [Bacteroides cellulosilyticus]MBV3636651.1 hypothetical protein [Bacteroides cellulosilyticus]MBV3662966.1 hypothetical protein [Bacteroides cellulosilyticus]MBV3684950.1 hypothetical protein [Bacteroides cellulosilyticus]MBV3693653.1 hypothetical protein [Bacteroides cellulosilyticus]MBV3707140.1 hypothetical protein [Bacteroides cellulosilyticus]
MKHKENYVSPRIEVIPMETESVIAVSGGSLPGVGDGGNVFGYHSTGTYRNGSTRSYNGAAGSDLEDLINDILTFEQ